jgi:hypothetical protein
MNDLPTICEHEYEDVQYRVSTRTIELAKIAGREPHEIKQKDYEQAKREIHTNSLIRLDK